MWGSIKRFAWTGVKLGYGNHVQGESDVVRWTRYNLVDRKVIYYITDLTTCDLMIFLKGRTAKFLDCALVIAPSLPLRIPVYLTYRCVRAQILWKY